MAAVADALVEARPNVECLQERYVAGDVAMICGAWREIGMQFVADSARFLAPS
jgi:hypothetical protein